MSLKKTLLALAGVSLMLAVVAVPAPAQAATMAELEAMIASLQATIQALQNGGVATPGSVVSSFAKDLTVGSTGADVMALQKFLNSKGFTVATTGAGSAGMESSYFGPATKAALAKYQAANGITPASGYFGPITRANVNQMGGTVTPPGTTPGTPSTPGTGNLEGGAGSVSEYTLMSGLTSEEVGEEEEAEVAGIEIEADDSSDIEITAVKLVFDEGTAASDFEDYASEVAIFFDGKEVARVDGDEFNDDNSWTKTITLDSGAVIKADDTSELTVAVVGVNNLDSSDVADTWTVDFRTIRFVDGLGASTSEDPGTGTRTFSFESFATATGAELKIASGDDDINDPHVLNVHATDETESEDVEIASFTLEAEGDSDLEIKKFGVNLDVTGAAHVDDIIAGGTSPAIRLIIDGEEYGTATYFDDADDTDVGTDEDVLFDDVDYTVKAGDTVDAKIVVDLLAVDTDLDEGDTIAVTLGETETDQATLVDVEDEAGESLADGDMTGTASAGAHGIFDTYIEVALVSKATPSVLADDDADDNDIVTFTMVFDITARDGSVYVGDTSAGTTVADGSLGVSVTDAINYRVYDSGSATTDDLADLITFTTPSGVTDSTDNILITDGHTSRVTLTVTQTNNSTEDDGIYHLDLASVGWGTADDTTYEFSYVFDLEDFETGTATIN